MNKINWSLSYKHKNSYFKHGFSFTIMIIPIALSLSPSCVCVRVGVGNDTSVCVGGDVYVCSEVNGVGGGDVCVCV